MHSPRATHTATPTPPAAIPPEADAAEASAPALPTCDTARKFVRVTERRADGLVAFEFAIGWPDLSVELLLPAAAFAEFCTAQQVQLLDH